MVGSGRHAEMSFVRVLFRNKSSIEEHLMEGADDAKTGALAE